VSDPDQVVELIAALHGAGVDLEPAALELAEHGDSASVILDRARADLFVRLHNRSDDFAATIALQAVNAASARLRCSVDRSERERLVPTGRLRTERARIWLKTRNGSVRRHAALSRRGVG
jgi:hypothetical protein